MSASPAAPALLETRCDAPGLRADGGRARRPRPSGLDDTATPLLALASACWTLPMANASRCSSSRLRASIAACGYRPLFLMMATYTALAFVAVLLVPRGPAKRIRDL